MLNALKVSTPSDTEILMTRQFRAPKKLVWEAMTTPELLRRWLFLPPGWSMASCEENLRAGGSFRWSWNGPDGNKMMEMHGTYKEVVPYERAVRTETFEMGCAAQAGEQIATMSLAEQGGVTTMTIRVVYPSKGARDGALASGMEQGMNAGYAQLDELLAASV